MSQLFLAIALLFLFGTLLMLPLFRKRAAGFRYFVSGASQTGDLLLRRNVVLDNLRDLEIEREHGKLNKAEFEALAVPLANELASIEKRLETARGVQPDKATRPIMHRLGFTCPACGNINRTTPADEDLYCTQCGTEFAQ